ncbi:MAG: Bax inhibitor-1/YccA family protein [Paludibacteraceae bacterium]|nr:Bax inhibitor-1/YccA family protein [Paludibacteraceae bacterium]
MNSNMENYQNEMDAPRVLDSSVAATLMRNVYYWMAGALTITGLTAMLVFRTPALMNLIFSSSAVLWGLLIGEIVLVMILSGAINRMSFSTATIMFLVYSVLNGLTLSSIFVLYTEGSIASTFFISAGMFGALAIYGSATKRDLSGIGRFLFMALIGLIIATVVNIFMHSPMLYWITTFAGVFIFAGLTAWDAQKIQELVGQAGEVNEATQKMALLGSLTLYLDFINLFLYLLRIFGKRR